MYDFMVIGHRGAAGYEPENTLRSFQKGIALGVDWIELDIRRTADGHIVVMHDDTVERTTNGRGKVSEMSLADIKKLDAGKGEKVPTLQEAIDVAKGKVKLIIELKLEGLEADVIDIVEKNGLFEDCIISSFFYYSIRRVKELRPGIMTAAIASKLPIEFHRLHNDFLADTIFLRKDIVSRDIVDEAHRDGFLVCVWNIDDSRDVARYADMGVDFISSNYPDRLRQIQPATAIA
ncbi:glycerophosphodiester phosphodiesterase [Methanocella sp. MCL-LM]|uniref:glycerophosphodiester phosphodiesterase n=1 Tax=Methanocella sp. MCL-LM TaxID=3412035 RepID=UPI003C72B5E5